VASSARLNNEQTFFLSSPSMDSLLLVKTQSEKSVSVSSLPPHLALSSCALPDLWLIFLGNQGRNRLRVHIQDLLVANEINVSCCLIYGFEDASRMAQTFIMKSK